MSLNHLKDINISRDTFQKEITQIWTLGDKTGAPIVGAPTVSASISFLAIGNIVLANIHPFTLTVPATGNYYSIVSTVPVPTEFKTSQINTEHIYLSKTLAGTVLNGSIYNYGNPTQFNIYEEYVANSNTVAPLTPNEIYKNIHYQNFIYLRTDQV